MPKQKNSHVQIAPGCGLTGDADQRGVPTWRVLRLLYSHNPTNPPHQGKYKYYSKCYKLYMVCVRVIHFDTWRWRVPPIKAQKPDAPPKMKKWSNLIQHSIAQLSTTPPVSIYSSISPLIVGRERPPPSLFEVRVTARWLFHSFSGSGAIKVEKKGGIVKYVDGCCVSKFHDPGCGRSNTPDWLIDHGNAMHLWSP